MSGIRYVALGDSYTIGTSVGEAERWPNQLVGALRGPCQLDLVANLGVNGYTSIDLIEDELPRLVVLLPEFVTVLIGVNDVVQGVPQSVYRANVGAHPRHARRGDGPPTGSSPSRRPTTRSRRRAPRSAIQPSRAPRSRASTRSWRRCRADARSVSSTSRRLPNDGAGDRGLVARDGLHPSGAAICALGRPDRASCNERAVATVTQPPVVFGHGITREEGARDARP